MSETFVLVCVSNRGVVSSSAYPSRYAADQAKSIALYGMTVEQVEAERLHINEQREKWEETHPWRQPANKSEREMIDSGASSSSSSSGEAWHMDKKNGLIREGYFAWNLSRNRDIRDAVVFKDAGDADAVNLNRT